MSAKSTQCDSSNDKIVDYWIFFWDKEWKWSRAFKFKYGFSHVCVLTEIDHNKWIILDPNFKRLQIQLTDLDAKQIKNTFNTKLIHIRKTQSCKKLWTPAFYFFSCVMAVQYICGMRIFAFTPYGLYKKLLHLSDKKRKLNGIISITEE